ERNPRRSAQARGSGGETAADHDRVDRLAGDLHPLAAGAEADLPRIHATREAIAGLEPQLVFREVAAVRIGDPGGLVGLDPDHAESGLDLEPTVQHLSKQRVTLPTDDHVSSHTPPPFGTPRRTVRPG